jgi:hypothetical protein
MNKENTQNTKENSYDPKQIIYKLLLILMNYVFLLPYDSENPFSYPLVVVTLIDLAQLLL